MRSVSYPGVLGTLVLRLDNFDDMRCPERMLEGRLDWFDEGRLDWFDDGRLD